jgi:hypothetical protein
MGHSRFEGGLLSGQAVSPEKLEWRADRSLSRQPSASGISRVRPATRSCVLDAGEVSVDLAGDVALEDAHDLRFGASFEQAPFDVGARAWIRTHAGEHDAPQGVVGKAVAAAVEPVADRLARRGVDRGDPAEVRERGLRGDPFGVVAGGDEEQGSGVDTDAGEIEQARGGRLDESGELVAEAGAVGVDVEHTAPEGLHRQLGGVYDGVTVRIRTQCAGITREAADRDAAEPFPQVIGRAEAKVAKLVEAFDTGIASGTVGDEQRPDRFHVAIRGLGHTVGR